MLRFKERGKKYIENEVQGRKSRDKRVQKEDGEKNERSFMTLIRKLEKNVIVFCFLNEVLVFHIPIGTDTQNDSIDISKSDIESMAKTELMSNLPKLKTNHKERAAFR